MMNAGGPSAPPGLWFVHRLNRSAYYMIVWCVPLLKAAGKRGLLVRLSTSPDVGVSIAVDSTSILNSLYEEDGLLDYVIVFSL